MVKQYIKYLLFGVFICLNAFAEINNENQQMLTGYTSFIKSADCYLKGSYGFEGLSGENCEVNGDLYQCCNILLSQYPAKISGYLSLYDKTGFVEYKELAEQFIDKLFKIYTSTKDKYGNNWLPTQDVVRKDGKRYWYTEGPHFSRNSSHPISYDQSNGVFMIDTAYSPDNFGIGLLETAKLIKKAEQEGRGKDAILSLEHRKKLTTMVVGILDFFHRDYMINRVKGNQFFRTTDVEPMNPKLPVPFPKFANEGADAIYSLLALNELGENTGKYDTSLTLFLEYYLSNRNDRDKDFRIYLLDNRVLDLCEYFQKRKIRIDLVKDVIKLLTEKYRQGTTKAVLMLSPTNNYSSTPFLEIYRKLKLKENFNLLLNDIWENNFSEVKGVLGKDGKDASVKVSASHVILCYAYLGWKDKIISDSEFIKLYNKYYMFKGNPKATRNLDNWVNEVDDWDKRNPGWQATPYDCFPESVEAEAYVNGKAQGYTVNRANVTLSTKEAQKKENQERNIYYQFVSPFTNHSEPLYYGMTNTFNLLDTKINKSISFGKTDETELKIKISYKEAAVPNGLQCFGVVDISEIHYVARKAPIKYGYEIKEVTYNDKNVPFTVSHIIDYKIPFSGENNAKLCFSIEASGKDGEVIIIARKRNNPYYIVGSENNMEKTTTHIKPNKPVDLPFTEKTGQDNNVDTSVLPEAYQWFEDNKDAVTFNIITEWKKWCLACLAENNKVTGKMESILKAYLGLVEKNKTEERYHTADRVIALSRIYYAYDGEYKEQLGKEVEKYTLRVLKNVSEATLSDDKYIEESESLIRYGILFPEKQKAKESLVLGLTSLKSFLETNINKEGFNVNKETSIIAQKLIEIERLCQLNAIEIPEEIYKSTEKILEFLMYCSNPDGTISEIIDKNKGNIRECMYWGSKIFKRSDFRYIAFGGLKMENSFQPEKISVVFPESNIYVMRNSWDIRDCNADGLREVERQKQLIINTRTGEISISAYNKELLSNMSIDKFEIIKWESNETMDRLVLKNVAAGYEKEIIYEKPNYWIIKIKGSSDIAQLFELKGTVIIKENDYVRTESRRREKLYGQMDVKMRYFGEIQVVPFSETSLSLQSEKQVVLSGNKNINFVIYPYVDDDTKCSFERIDEKYQPSNVDSISLVFGDKESHWEKRISYVPKIEIKENEKGEVVICEALNLNKTGVRYLNNEGSFKQEIKEGK